VLSAVNGENFVDPETPFPQLEKAQTRSQYNNEDQEQVGEPFIILYIDDGFDERLHIGLNLSFSFVKVLELVHGSLQDYLFWPPLRKLARPGMELLLDKKLPFAGARHAGA
jgi:hypothetical protein